MSSGITNQPAMLATMVGNFRGVPGKTMSAPLVGTTLDTVQSITRKVLNPVSVPALGRVAA